MLAPHLARLFALMIEKASIPAYWKGAKLSPLYKNGPALDPDLYTENAYIIVDGP